MLDVVDVSLYTTFHLPQLAGLTTDYSLEGHIPVAAQTPTHSRRDIDLEVEQPQPVGVGIAKRAPQNSSN